MLIAFETFKFHKFHQISETHNVHMGEVNNWPPTDSRFIRCTFTTFRWIFSRVFTCFKKTRHKKFPQCVDTAQIYTLCSQSFPYMFWKLKSSITPFLLQEHRVLKLFEAVPRYGLSKNAKLHFSAKILYFKIFRFFSKIRTFYKKKTQVNFFNIF